LTATLRAQLASRNQHKLEELRATLRGWQIELLGAEEFPEEEGRTYYENARAKARFGRTVADPAAWVLGEDSGVEVEALGGRPGIQSARWAADPVTRLLEELNGVDDRRACYVCELVCLSPASVELRGTGLLAGRIAHEPRGSEGFGYDPIFVPEGEGRTVAELGNDWKTKNSHRARAAAALRNALALRRSPAAARPLPGGEHRATSSPRRRRR
jgi:XTP/dITP diphosphohydrolase